MTDALRERQGRKATSGAKRIVIMILWTVLFLAIYRLGVFIQLPYINMDLFKSSENLFGFLDVFSGGALSNFSILALGISPYITSSIVIQLLEMDIIPTLKEWREEGENGKKKLNNLTKYVALGLAFVQALTLTLGINVSYNDNLFVVGVDPNAFTYAYLAIVCTAGTAFTLWIAELITRKGIGNGSSMIIVAGIVASFPQMIGDLLNTYINVEGATTGDLFTFIGVLLVMILMVVGIIFMECSQRKIPVQYANRPAAAAFRGKNDSNIPIKLNSASVIPVIFASTLMSLPSTILNFLDSSNNVVYWLKQIFTITTTDASGVVSINPIAFVLYIVLIIVFSFFYSFLQMNPEDMAKNLQKNGAYIPSIKPGDATASYISRVLFKITMIGATYLTIVAIIPIVMSAIFNLPSSVQVGGTSLIIVVGVAMETAKQLKTEAQDKQYSSLY